VIWKLIRSLKLARKILKDFNPSAVVGVGGYASGPVMRQAGKLRIPLIIQEQNSYAGITNKLLAKKASLICVAYDGMEKYFPAEKIIKTGNPVRQSFDNLDKLRAEALGYFNLNDKNPVVLILGGSLGAGTINRSLAENIGTMAESGIQWIWQTGTYYFEDINALVGVSSASDIKVHGFINRMDLAFAAADIIVSRAGAGTISELCIVGKPVILVPSPNVAEDHQTKNAFALVHKNAAIMVPDNHSVETLVAEVMKLMADQGKREQLSENISAMADRNADTRIAREIIKLMQE